jgi:hypothetical protein
MPESRRTIYIEDLRHLLLQTALDREGKNQEPFALLILLYRKDKKGSQSGHFFD